MSLVPEADVVIVLLREGYLLNFLHQLVTLRACDRCLIHRHKYFECTMRTNVIHYPLIFLPIQSTAAYIIKAYTDTNNTSGIY